MDIAALGFRVDSKPLADANRELGKMPSAAAAAERSSKGVSAANDNAAKSASRLARQSNLLASSFRYVVRALAPMAAALAAAFSLGPVFRFMDAMGEVSTLVDTATFDMQRLRAAALEQNAAFGGGATQQAKAFYQIISAGAASAAQANEILTASNKLAIGGVTQVSIAADGLTSVLNAYGDKVESAAAVSDALFVAMRAGKTTIGELSSGLGKVAPLAAQTGVSFDELAGAVSALTKGGISTQESITGVRAVLAAVAKPTSEAVKLSKQLGLEFNSAALASKGFEGFLSELVKRTGGNTDALAKLFGGVEALIPIMALSGQAGRDFTSIMEQMADKAGATEDAFNKMANTPGFQAGRVWGALETEVIKVASALGNAMVPALRFVADNMENIFRLAKIAGAALLVAFAPSLLAAMASGFVALGVAGVTAIRAITVAIAMNPIGALAVGITLAAAAVWQFRDTINQALGVDVVGIAKSAANLVINSFAAAFADIKFVWQQLPNIMGAVIVGAVNVVASGTEKMINFAIAGINRLIGAVNSLPDWLKPEALENISPIGEFSVGRMDNPAAAALGDANQWHELHVRSILARDNFKGIGDAASEASGGVNDMSGAIAAANDNLEDLGEKGGGALKKVKEEIDKAAQAAVDFGKDLVKGFVSDLRSGLEQGKGFWRSFGDAALNVLDKVIDKLLNNFIDAIFQVNSASAGIGGKSGGFLGGIFGWIGKLFGFAGGGYTGNGAASAAAGVVHGQEYVFSASATKRIGVANLDAMHNAAKGYRDGGYVMPAAANQNRQPLVIYVVGEEGSSFVPRVRKISGDTAGVVVQESAPKIVGTAVNQSTSRVVPTMARYQQETAGGEYRG